MAETNQIRSDPDFWEATFSAEELARHKLSEQEHAELDEKLQTRLEYGVFGGGEFFAILLACAIGIWIISWGDFWPGWFWAIGSVTVLGILLAKVNKPWENIFGPILLFVLPAMIAWGFNHYGAKAGGWLFMVFAVYNVLGTIATALVIHEDRAKRRRMVEERAWAARKAAAEG